MSLKERIRNWWHPAFAPLTEEDAETRQKRQRAEMLAAQNREVVDQLRRDFLMRALEQIRTEQRR